MKKFQPIGKYIVIKTVEEELKTSSGLYMTQQDTSQMRYKRGTVIKPGTDVTVIKEDDEIYYDKAAGFTMLIKDNPYTVISERDIVVVL